MTSADARHLLERLLAEIATFRGELFGRQVG